MSRTASSFEPVQSWVDGRSPSGAGLDPDEDLFAQIITDSLDFVEFLFVVEEARAQPIQSNQMDVEAFRTLNRIRETFFASV